MDVARRLAEHVVKTKYGQLSDDVLRGTKNAILDTIGSLAAGACAPGCESAVALAKEWGGRGESTILVHGGKVPCHNAAMVNSVMARAVEMDEGVKALHRSASSVPTALAVAEMCGGVDGKEFITAVAIGEDVASRISFSTTYRGFDHTGICMPLGACAVAGRLLGLNSEQMLHALGIVFNQVSGSMQGILDGALVVRMVQGFASRSGVESALLAKRGITGVKNILEGVYGFFHLYSGAAGNMETLLDGLGQTFMGVASIGLKKYSSCGLTLAATQIALELVTEHDIMPEDVDEVVVGVSQGAITVAGRPFEVRESPQVDAQFSIPYTVANVLLRRDSRLEHFSDTYVADPAILPIAEKVRVIGSGATGLVAGFTNLEIGMKDGRRWSKSVNYRKGYPEDPLTETELLDKFRVCMGYGPKPFPSDRVEQVAEVIDKLEEQRDVSHLAELLVI